MRTTILTALGLFLFFSISSQAGADVENDMAGVWSLYSFDTPDGGSKPLTGIWWNQDDGQFIHQVMHSGEPLQSQIAECHLGRYEVLSPGKMKVDVEKGSVANSPKSDTLLSTRNNMSFDMGYERSGDKLKIGHEHLVQVKTKQMEIFSLDNGKLALSDEHILLVSITDAGPLCGAGRYRREGDRLHLQGWNWFNVEKKKVSYSVDENIEAGFDGKELRLPTGERFRVVE
ncbi:MAG: hypothetical protein ACI9SC_000913 [Gammaproteobacteria bacterium]|jgi:hypothetical protein